MIKPALVLCLFPGALLGSACLMPQGGRPESLTLSNFQFGPQNRWSFSHPDEVLPTSSIEHDADRVSTAGSRSRRTVGAE